MPAKKREERSSPKPAKNEPKRCLFECFMGEGQKFCSAALEEECSERGSSVEGIVWGRVVALEAGEERGKAGAPAAV